MIIIIGHLFALPGDDPNPPVDANRYLVDNASNQLTDNNGNYLIYVEED